MITFGNGTSTEQFSTPWFWWELEAADLMTQTVDLAAASAAWCFYTFWCESVGGLTFVIFNTIGVPTFLNPCVLCTY